MKILLIVPEFPPNHIGGGGVVFENLAKTYKHLGHDVLVISGDYTRRNLFCRLKIKTEQNIDIIRIPELYTPASLLNTVMPIAPWHSLMCKKIIKEFQPNFTHIHGYGLFMPAQLAHICQQLKVPYTFTIHGAPVSPEKMKNPLISIAYEFYHRLYGFPLLEGAKRLTAVSGFARDFKIFKPWKEKIEIIGNGINPDEYKDPGYDIYEQRGIRKNKNAKIILSLGRIEWIKGFEKIIELIPAMLEKGYDAQYVIAGKDNGYMSSLIATAKGLGVIDRIHFLGFITGKDKMSLLYYTDILAVPSVSEAFPIVPLEGRICNKPILTTFAGGIVDALDSYDVAYSLDKWEDSFNSKLDIVDKKNFSWEKIAKIYIL